MAEAATAESRELTCWAAFRNARAQFQNDIIAHAQAHASDQGRNNSSKLSRDEFTILRGEHAYTIAEFYYLIGEQDLVNKTKIRMFLQRHNADMTELLSNKESRDARGLSPQRIEEAIFSPPQIEKVVENIVDSRLRLDQSDLGRILAPIISTETCRKTVVILAKGGLITRINIGQVLVISNGNLEKYFKKHLSSIVSALNQRPI